MVFIEQGTFELHLEMWVSRSYFWGPNEQGGKRSWKRRNSMDTIVETCKSMTCLGTTGNQTLEYKGREIRVEEIRL